MGQEEIPRTKFQEPNLHVYDKNDTEIMIYNMRISPRKGDRKNTRKRLEK